ncbi:MAG: NAD(P)H-quinone dehydrogenase [Nostocoides sp.]
MVLVNARTTRVVILGGGPGGYEAALVAAQLGATVTVVDGSGLGGAAVLTDCVPSKALISVADFRVNSDAAVDLGLQMEDAHGEAVTAGSVAAVARVNERIRRLAAAQSSDIAARLASAGVAVLPGRGALDGTDRVAVTAPDGHRQTVDADVILVATGATPRVIPSAQPDGERILTWQQIYDLTELPEHLIVVGSGVTGAELAQAYLGLGAHVTLVSSRDQVLPGHDVDAAAVIEDVFTRRGMNVLSRSRMSSIERTHRDGQDGVLVTLEDGSTVAGSHALIAVGATPNTEGIGLAEAGILLSESGHIKVDRVSRTSARGVYAAGDCTGVLALASVAAMQGRIAMWHALGDAVTPLNLAGVSANIFTDPEIATVGVQQGDIDAGRVDAEGVILPLSGNPRAKMMGIADGFVKLFAHPGSGTVLGGVVVAPRASELIFPVTLAVQHRLQVDQVASTFTVYPSLTGSIAEAARQLHPTR